MGEKRFPIAPQAERALALLRAGGFEAWLVGGCVRDFLLGRTPKDYDLATNAMPKETEDLFREFSVIETGLRHGTVTVLLEGLPLEITTYRVDGPYSDTRHPDQVQFTSSLREDAARRDFTVNAMAYHPEAGLRDFFGGREDLAQKRIRCVGNPDVRFREDALRMLRGVRFASVLGFSVEEKTRGAIHRNRMLLSRVAPERVAPELCRLLCGEKAGDMVLDYTDLLGVVIPELLPMAGFDQKNRHHCHDVLTHTAAALDQTPPEVVLRLAVLLHDIGKPRCFSQDGQGEGHFYGHAGVSANLAEDILRRLRLDNATRERVVTLIRYHDSVLEADPRLVRRWLGRLTPEIFFQLLQVQRADNLGQAPAYWNRQKQYDRLEGIAKEILASQACFSLKTLAVNGKDLLALGYRGPEVGKILQTLLHQVMDGKVPNEKNLLLQLANKKHAKNGGNAGEIP